MLLVKKFGNLSLQIVEDTRKYETDSMR